MHIGLAYAEPGEQVWLQLELPEGSTIGEAIEASGILRRFPSIDLARQKVGVYGKVKPLDAVLEDGDRVEIYRPIVADPKTVRRRRQKDGATEED